MAFASVFVCAALSGCSTQSTLAEADRSVPTSYRGAVGSPDLPRPTSEWWREFASAELDRLQESALANNRDLQIAIARVAQANAQARITDSAQYPSLDIFARREAEAPRVGVGLAQTPSQWDQLNRVRAGLRTSYEADLWGKSGYATDSAVALAIASVHQRQTVALTLTADLAAAYLEYLSLSDRLVLAERGVQSRRNQLLATDKRLRQGDATALETAQVRVALATSQSAASVLDQRRERAFNRVALLVGVSPAQLKINAHSLSGVNVPAIDPGLPSELLCRRPDVRRVEAQLAAAAFDVRSLRASLLPSFSLQGVIGFGAQHLAALTNPASLFFLASANLLQSVFDAGRRESQIEMAVAKHLELLHQYSNTLLTALRDVEDALAGARLTADQYRALADAVDGAKANYTLNRLSFDAGAVDYFALLDAEQRVVGAEDSSEAALYERLRVAVDLYRALGGGSRVTASGECSE